MNITIENAKRKVSFKVSSNSNFSIFEVGTHKMENSKIVANIATAIEQLKEKWPGGWKNILRLYLKPMRQSKVSIPIYYSKVNPNDIEVPVEVGVKQTRLDKITEQLAKRSKKLRVDRKSKKIVKVKDESAGNDKNTDKKKQQKKNKKDKKRKLDQPETDKVEAESKAKKEKKTSVSENPAADQTEPKKKKKKTSESNATIEEPKEAKKKLKAEPETVDQKADSKKKKKSAAVVEAEPTVTDKTKKKNKKNKA